MPELSLLAVFIPTFFFISITPGMCMTLALTLGISIGVRKTLWMMLGEVSGVALVAVMAVLGVATMMLNHPQVFTIFKYVGATYLIYIGLQSYFKTTKVQFAEADRQDMTRVSLVSQGFITAIANPKGWAFMISILPPFIDIQKGVALQLSVLVLIIMCSELICMLIYASGGKGLRVLLSKGDNAIWLNRISGTLLIAVGIWLALA